MIRYTNNIDFKLLKIGRSCIEYSIKSDWVPKPFPLNPLYERITKNFNTEYLLFLSCTLNDFIRYSVILQLNLYIVIQHLQMSLKIPLR